jgi:hypothetical protein
MGFCVATAGAFVILFFYKLLGGYWFREGEGEYVRSRRYISNRRYRNGRYYEAEAED